MPLVNTYQQADEPTDLQPGTRWLADDGREYIRKRDLTWNYIGDWEVERMGNLGVEGGTTLGPIYGAHGLARTSDPDFSGVATINGIDLADKQWVTDQLAALQDTINNLISNQIGGDSGNITIGGNLAVGYGEVADGGAIPLPTYADNTRAAKAEVWGVMATVKHIQGRSDAITSFDWDIDCSVDANLVVTCKYTGWTVGPATASYIVICKR